MLFEEGNDPLSEVIQSANSVGHSITVISSDYATTEEFLQRVQQLNVTLVLNDREFGEHLKLAGHFGMRIDADEETSFAVYKAYNPLSV